jgi:hypothetical protein
MLGGGEVDGVRQIGIGEQRQGWEFSHGRLHPLVFVVGCYSSA